MSRIPRFISKTPVTPSIIRAHLDPNVAAAPFKEQERAAAQLSGIVQSEMNQWGNVLRAKKAEEEAANKKQAKIQDNLYKAQAVADVSVASNFMYQEQQKQADGNTNFANSLDQQFQTLADNAIVGAPSQDAQIDLTKRFIGMRGSLYNKATNRSLTLNNQVNMNKIEGMLREYEGLAVSDPSSIEEIKGQLGDVVGAMEALGLPKTAQTQILDKFNTRLEYNAAKAVAEGNPQASLSRIQKGELAYLGEGNVQSLKNIAIGSAQAHKKQAGEALQDVDSRLFAGQAVPTNLEDIFNLANKYGLEGKVGETKRLIALDKSVAQASAADLRGMQDAINVAAARGELNAAPSRVQKLKAYVDGNLKSMQDDPMSYVEQKSNFTPMTPIQDFSRLDRVETEQRKLRALQAEEILGIPAPALKKIEIENLADQLVGMPARDKVDVLDTINQLGSRTVEAVAKALEVKDPAMSIAARTNFVNEHIAFQIMQGKDVIKAGRAIKHTAAEINEANNTVFKRLFIEDIKIQARYMEAAKALQAYQLSIGNEVDLEDALQKVSSVIHVDRAGLFSGSYSTLAPIPGMDEDDIETVVDETLQTKDDWKKWGNGTPLSIGGTVPLNFTDIEASDFEYISDGTGKYYVMRNGQKLMTEDGNVYTIDLVNMSKEKGMGD